MSSALISENILESFEARSRRVKSPRKGGAKIYSRRSQEKALSDCTSSLEQALRTSIRSSFERWELELVPQIEGLARRIAGSLRDAPARGKAPPADSGPTLSAREAPKPSPETLATPGKGRDPSQHPEDPPRTPGETRGGAGLRQDPPGDPPGKGGGGAGRGPQESDSWYELVEAVHELRREWDRETFERALDRRSKAPPEQKVQPGSAPPPSPPAAAPPAGIQAIPEDSAPARPRFPEEPEPPESSPDARKTVRIDAVPLEGPPPAAAEERPHKVDVVSEKIDELLRLVKASLGHRPPGRNVPIPPEITSQIAREVAGRLRETLSSWSQTSAPAAEKPQEAPRPTEAVRIPIGDIAAMIDQINGAKGR